MKPIIFVIIMLGNSAYIYDIAKNNGRIKDHLFAISFFVLGVFLGALQLTCYMGLSLSDACWF